MAGTCGQSKTMPPAYFLALWAFPQNNRAIAVKKLQSPGNKLFPGLFLCMPCFGFAALVKMPLSARLPFLPCLKNDGYSHIIYLIKGADIKREAHEGPPFSTGGFPVNRRIGGRVGCMLAFPAPGV